MRRMIEQRRKPGKEVMSTKTKKSRSTRQPRPPASIVWFEVPADDVERARKFYSALFGWKINPFPGASERVGAYWHIDTGGADASPDGGLHKRMHPQQAITQYVAVPSVTTFMAKVKKLGGKVTVPKTSVPQMGYFAICQDTENNVFALWEKNAKAR
jgi:uncharacterized protein